MPSLRLFGAVLESQEERGKELVWLRGLSIWFSDKLSLNCGRTFFLGQELVPLSARQAMNKVWLKFQELVTGHTYMTKAGCGRVSSPPHSLVCCNYHMHMMARAQFSNVILHLCNGWGSDSLSSQSLGIHLDKIS